MGDGESDSFLPYLQMFAPLIPQIINKNNTPSLVKSNTTENASTGEGSTATPPESKPKIMKSKSKKAQLEEYKQKIKSGEIGTEEAYTEFLKTEYANTLTKEQFTAKFNEIKQSI
jgi:hypothetical protein